MPGPCTVEWKKKVEQDLGAKQKSNHQSHKALRNVPLTNNKSFPVSNNISKVHDYHRKTSVGRKENTHGAEHVVMDRYGRPMTVQAETAKILNQLPDLSFLNARTLLFNREQRQIVPDLGAMINRKMPGWVTSVWMRVWKGQMREETSRRTCCELDVSKWPIQSKRTSATFQTCVQTNLWSNLGSSASEKNN